MKTESSVNQPDVSKYLKFQPQKTECIFILR